MPQGLGNKVGTLKPQNKIPPLITPCATPNKHSLWQVSYDIGGQNQRGPRFRVETWIHSRIWSRPMKDGELGQGLGRNSDEVRLPEAPFDGT